jgi:hypothetical protein
MRRFKKRDNLNLVVLPGIGRLRNDQVLEGDEWARYCPQCLVEILDSTSPPLVPLEAKAPLEKQELLLEIAKTDERPKATEHSLQPRRPGFKLKK